MSIDNKQFIAKMQEILKAKGYEVKTSHLYDAFAQLDGHKNWHVASAKGAELSGVMKKFKSDLKVENVLSSNYLDQISSKLVSSQGKESEFDIFDHRLASWNYLVSGQTGSGKTVLVNKLIASLLKDKKEKSPIVYVMDVGGDNGGYKTITKLFGGEIVNVAKTLPKINVFEINTSAALPNKRKTEEIAKFFLDKNPDLDFSAQEMSVLVKQYFHHAESFGIWKNSAIDAFNEIFPFSFESSYKEVLTLSPGNCVPNQKQLSFIVDVLDVMRGQPYLRSDLEDSVLDLYESTENIFPTLSDLVAPGSRAAGSWKSKLKRWTKSGEFPMFDKESNFSIKNSFTVFDLKGLNWSKELSSVYTMLIMNKMDNLLTNNNSLKLMVFDEMYQNLSDDNFMKQYIKTLREARIKGFATISINQLPTDLLVNKEHGQAALALINCHIMGKMDPTNAQKAAINIGLNEDASYSLSKAGPVKTVNDSGLMSISETKFLLHSHSFSELIGVKLSAFESILYSANSRERVVIDYYLNLGKSMGDIIDMMSKDKHKEDAGLITFLKEKT